MVPDQSPFVRAGVGLTVGADDGADDGAADGADDGVTDPHAGALGASMPGSCSMAASPSIRGSG